MRYRLFLFKPKHPRVRSIVYWDLDHFFTESFSKDAADSLGQFDAKAVQEELQNSLLDRAKVLLCCPPEPYTQASFLKISTSFTRIKEIMACASRHGLMIWDREALKTLRTDDFVESGFIDAESRGKQLCAAIRQIWNKKEIWDIVEVDTEIDHPSNLHFVIRLRKRSESSFLERVSELYRLLLSNTQENEKLICQNQSFIIDGDSYSVTFYLEGYKRANLIGYMEDKKPQVSLMHRMGYDAMRKWLYDADEIERLDTLYRLNFYEYRERDKNLLDTLAASIRLTKKLKKLPYRVAIGPIRKPCGSNMCFHILPEEIFEEEENLSMLRIEDLDAVILYRFILDICPYLQDRWYDTTYLPLEYLELMVKRLQAARKQIVSDPFDESLTPYFQNEHFLPLDKEWISENRWDMVKLFDAFIEWSETQLNLFLSEARTLVIFGP